MNIKKNIIVSMTMIILTLCLQGTISSAVEGKQNLDYWDITKEYMMTNQNVTYHAYLSKDKKESWIFKADVAKDKKRQMRRLLCLDLSQNFIIFMFLS